MMGVRRVVTGHDENGKAVFASDEVVAPVTVSLVPGGEFHLLWGGDDVAHFPDDGSMPERPSYFPPRRGFRFAFFSVPPAGTSPPEDLDVPKAFAELEEKLPGLAGHMERDNPGMHTTASIDFEVVVSGHPTLELDDGAKTTLNPGDTVVQNGTRHRWSNEGSEPAVLAVVLIGAHHDRIPEP